MSVLHRAVYYPSQASATDQWLASHYAEAIVPEGPPFDSVKSFNPAFIGYAYKSATDDETPDPMLAAACAATGIAVNDCYQHWAEPTVMQYGEATQTFAAGDKVLAYQPSTRTLCSFIPGVRPARTEYMRRYMQIRSPGGRLWDGLFLDNSSPVLFSFGEVVSGGTVQECGFKIGSAQYQSWHWQNLRDWVKEVRTAIAPKLLAINIDSIWAEDAVTLEIADRLFQEYVGDPIRDSDPPIDEVARRHRLAADHGLGMWASANPTLGNPAETYQEMQYACLCLHLCVMQAGSSTHIQNGNYPNVPNWTDLVISPVEANHQFTLLGTPTGDVELVGTRGPAGRQQHLWRRMFAKGAVYVRNLEPWDGLTTETWDVPLGPQMIYIQPDGVNAYPRPSSVAVKNGGGAIFVLAH